MEQLSQVSQLVVSGITSGCIYAIVAVGFSIIYNSTRVINFAQGDFSFLKITGYSLLVGYQPKDARRVYLRYAALNNNRSPVPGEPLTYDTRQVTLGVVQPIRRGVWAEFQYERNMESGGDVDNDLLFVEFFTGF